jgi:hypothetical protein
LGINFDVDLDEIVNINYNERISQIKKLINIWSKRIVTFIPPIFLLPRILMAKISAYKIKRYGDNESPCLQPQPI